MRLPACLPLAVVFTATVSPTSAPTVGMAPTAPSPGPDTDTYVGCHELVEYSNEEFDWDNLSSDSEMTPTVSSSSLPDPC